VPKATESQGDRESDKFDKLIRVFVCSCSEVTGCSVLSSDVA